MMCIMMYISFLVVIGTK